MANSPQETRVLAIASHVTHGYVGNKMATFVMQALGCDVSAIDTVHFSNHTAYKQFKGRRVPAEEIQDLYDGLKQCGLNDFDMMLSGYTASKAAVKTVGAIGRELRLRANMKPGSFFWILDPVMGDEGRLYVAEEIVPAYKTLLHDADLILPNCFEAELLSGVRITDMKSLVTAITVLHKTYQIPHIVVTSLHISAQSKKRRLSNQADEIAVVGSTCRTDFSPRVFSVSVPALDIFFSGTGDMFAALTLVRMREAAGSANPPVLDKHSWRSPDDVAATDLPLAKATEKTLASMHAVLMKTAATREEELKGVQENDDMKMHVKQTKASEVRVVRFVDDLRKPKLEGIGVQFKAESVEVQDYEVEKYLAQDFGKIEVTEKTGAAKLKDDQQKADQGHKAESSSSEKGDGIAPSTVEDEGIKPPDARKDKGDPAVAKEEGKFLEKK